MFEVLKELQCRTKFCFVYTRLFGQVNLDLTDLLLLLFLLVMVLFALAFQYSDVRLDATPWWDAFFRNFVSGFVTTFACICICHWMCLRVCETFDDCPRAKIVDTYGTVLGFVISMSFEACFIKVKGYPSELFFVLVTWRFFMHNTFQKHKEHCHLLSYCSNGK